MKKGTKLLFLKKGTKLLFRVMLAEKELGTFSGALVPFPPSSSSGKWGRGKGAWYLLKEKVEFF